MGSLARDLETSFKEGYIDSDYTPPSLSKVQEVKKRINLAIT
jgi:hypothetical protein